MIDGTSAVPTVFVPTSSPGEVGDGTSVGTGISVGEASTAEDDASTAAEDPGGTEVSGGAGAGGTGASGNFKAMVGISVAGSRVCSCSGTGDVGEGSSVGTGISLGEDGALALIPADSMALAD